MPTTMDKAQVTMPSDREVKVTRSFKAPRPLVYRAYTEPELVRRWLLGPPGWSMPVWWFLLPPETTVKTARETSSTVTFMRRVTNHRPLRSARQTLSAPTNAVTMLFLLTALVVQHEVSLPVKTV